MAGNRTQQQSIQDLSRSVDVLAMRIVMGDEESRPFATSTAVESPGLTAALTGIKNHAVSADCRQTAAAADDLLSTLTNAATGPDFESWLSGGILRLQQALEGELSIPSEPPRSGSSQSLAQDPELVSDFILEAREHICSVESQMLAVEQDPHNPEPVHSAFRGFHTVKGLAGFLEFGAIQEVAHEIETVLDRARNTQLAITPEVVDVVLAAGDHLKLRIQDIEDALQGKAVSSSRDHEPLIRRIRCLLAEDNAGSFASERNAVSASVVDKPVPGTPEPVAGPGADVEKLAEAVAETSPTAETASGPVIPPRATVKAVKVGTAKLDHLVDMVGEMVIAQSLLRNHPDVIGLRSQRLQRTISQLSRITTDVQHTAMSMRMVPVDNLFRRMSRLVRDLSRKAGKHVDFAMSGEDTELDRNIVEELADPLMHMVRNSIDHGLETPEERKQNGKDPHGRVSLRAYHQSGLIVIELSDDGRGLDRERILAKARQRELVEGGDQLSDNEVFNFIFEPGFSTAAKLTTVSGRGVGMDVVKRNITKLRGRIDIRSSKGKGATFTLKVPLTLAIIDALVVGVGKERYVIPVSTVGEMFRPAPEAVFTVENRAEMVMVRDNLLPMIRLYKRFNVTPRSEDPAQSVLIVSEAAGKRFCLMVDELIGKTEVVIKSLGDVFKNIRGVAGGAILGDGHVGIILDMDGIFGRPSMHENGPAALLPVQVRALSGREFEDIRRLAHERFGLDLKPGKEELVSARLGRKIREGSFGSYREYIDFVLGDGTGQALMGLIDALTTNFTSFFREQAHFDFLRKTVLPALKARKEALNVWCAACSTGEEPYSLAFTLQDELEGSSPAAFRILATDISTRALDTARAGVYPADRFEQLTTAWLRKYLLRGEGKWQGNYRVKPEIRRLVEFQRLNLIDHISHPRKFSLIFCRNVLIYFDKPTQEAVVQKLADWLEPGGYLFVGHAESLTGVRHRLKYVQPAVYTKEVAVTRPEKSRRLR